MAKLQIKQGATSKLIHLFIQDSSATTGAGLTGLTSGSSGLTAYYFIEGASSAVAISLSSGTLGTWSSGGFVAVDGTNMPGLYELGIPNLALASGKSVKIYLKGATNMAQTVAEIELTQVDNQSAATFMTGINGLAPPTNFNLLSIDSSGQVKTSYAMHKNTSFTAFPFLMTDSTTHLPKTGATITAQRSIDGAAFGSCTNSATELSNGVYLITLSAADLNGNSIVFRFSATGADDTFLTVITQS